jgi:signal transduction histidine kinase
METTGAGGQPPRARSDGLGTRGRLLAAFAALAATFAAGFGLEAHRLGRMAHGIAELREHQVQMHLALQVEDAVREEYDRRVRALAGEPIPLVEADEVVVGELVRRLSETVDEPEARGWIERLAIATRALEALCRADLEALASGRPPAPGAEQSRFALVFQIEEDVDSLFAFLSGRSVAQSEAIEDLRRASLRLALAFAVGLPLFALAIGLYLSRAIGRPLVILGEGAERIAAGDLRTRIAVQGPRELSALADRFNGMAAALERDRERLVRSEKLALLGRLAAGVAHEINNPLQVIVGYLSLHRGRVGGELGLDLARVDREAGRCKEIVEELLQLSRPTATAPPEPVDLREVSQEVAEAIRVAMPEAPRLQVVGEARALGSPARFRQVIFNLVKNAAEAAGPAGRVEVEIGYDRDAARVVVSDTGPGVPSTLRDRVFEPFYTTKTTGTGLGLALARAIAQAHGGDVELEPGSCGARFSLRAPRVREGAWT